MDSNIDITGVRAVIDHFGGRCAYCDKIAEALDHPFPLSGGAPNVAANVLPVCRSCRAVKGAGDIVSLYDSGVLMRDRYVELIRGLLMRDNDSGLCEHIKKAVGIIT